VIHSVDRARHAVHTSGVDTVSRTSAASPSLRATRAPAVRRTLLVILVLNAIVVVAKAVVGVRTQSLSVLGAALDSSLDLLTNIVGMVLVRIAALGPDEEHPYGHAKFETVGALGIVGFLSITCFELLRRGVASLIHRRAAIVPGVPELVLIAATMGVNIFVVWYERRRGRALQSSFLLADAAHTRSDVYITAAAFASLAFARAGLGLVDPILAIIVALVIARNGYAIVRDTIPVLVDERGVDAADVRRVLATIPRIADVRAVRSRSSASGMLFAEVTIAVDALTSVANAHDIADAVEAAIDREFGPAEVIVHVEPT
jgi:cation diffusion facilitator family transporter